MGPGVPDYDGAPGAVGPQALAALTDPSGLQALVLALLTGTLFTGVAAFRRARPQATLDTVSAMSLLTKEMRGELDRKDDRITEMERRLDEKDERITLLEQRLDEEEEKCALALASLRSDMTAEIEKLRARIRPA